MGLEYNANNIKTIFTDWYGVIQEFDYTKFRDSFFENVEKKYNLNNKNINYTIVDVKQFKQDIKAPYQLFKVGKISPYKFWTKIMNVYNIDTSVVKVNDVKNSIVNGTGNINSDLMRIIKENIKNVAILSNGSKELYLNQKEILEMYDIDSKILYSSWKEKMKKPDEIFFKKVLNDYNVNPKDTIYIDDQGKNLIKTKEMGFNTIYYNMADPKSNIKELEHMLQLIK